MDDSGAILCQISSLKDMLDQVNEEIEANIQTTRDIESEIVKCSEMESRFAMRESELTKMIYVAEFEMNSLIQVNAAGKTSLDLLEKELSCLRMKQDEGIKRLAHKRICKLMPDDTLEEGSKVSHLIADIRKTNGLKEQMTPLSELEDKGSIYYSMQKFSEGHCRGENEELRSLLLEKDLLENQNDNLNAKIDVLRNSMLAFVEEILGELQGSSFALNVDIQCGDLENKKLLEDIDELKTSLLAISSCRNHPWDHN